MATVLVGDYYELKARLERVMERLGKKMWIDIADNCPKCFEVKRSGDIYVGKTRKESVKVGTLGELKVGVRRKMKLEPVVTAMELSLDVLMMTSDADEKKVRISKYPIVGRDVTVRVKSEVSYDKVYLAVEDGLMKQYVKKGNVEEIDLIYKMIPKSIYERGDKYKNISFHLEFSDTKKTLGDKEIKIMMDNIEKSVKTMGGEIV